MVGNSMSWWAIDGKGYTCDIQRAGVYTKEEAFAQHRMRSTDRPWPKRYIDGRLSHHVDFQHVDHSLAVALFDSAPSELEKPT